MEVTAVLFYLKKITRLLSETWGEPFVIMQELGRSTMPGDCSRGQKSEYNQSRSQKHQLSQKHVFLRKLFIKQSSFADVKNMGSSYKNNKKSLQWYCQVCSLVLTSKVQAQEHFFGKKHQSVAKSTGLFNQSNRPCIAGQRVADKKRLVVIERLRSSSKSSFDQNLGSGNEIIDSNDVVPPPAGRDNILETVIKSERKTFYASDLSIYRTPSGKYYCQTCNVTVKSQAQFFQHSESRKHKYKANRASVKMK